MQSKLYTRYGLGQDHVQNAFRDVGVYLNKYLLLHCHHHSVDDLVKQHVFVLTQFCVCTYIPLSSSLCLSLSFSLSLYVCVCVCVCVRERERMCVCVCARKHVSMHFFNVSVCYKTGLFLFQMT